MLAHFSRGGGLYTHVYSQYGPFFFLAADAAHRLLGFDFTNTAGPTRAGALPDVPTIKEQGYPSLEFSSWFGIVAPAKTPADIVAKLNADIVKAVASPEGKAKLEELGFRVTGTSRDQFARIIAADTVTWGKAVAATGFKAD